MDRTQLLFERMLEALGAVDNQLASAEVEGQQAGEGEDS